MSSRLVVLGLARPGAAWFADVARWASSGVLGIEFHKAVSVAEAHAQFASGRVVSALLVDARLPGVDRELVAAAAEHGCTTILVAESGFAPDLGAAETLAPDFGPDELRGALTAAEPVPSPTDVPGLVDPADAADDTAPSAATVVVLGAGGAGTSTIASALAQGLAGDGEVLLADFALHADLALLHDVGDIIPGVPELVDAFRSGIPDAAHIRALTFTLAARGHRLLLGLRRHRDWTSLRARSLRAAIDGLQRSFDVVVIDTDADLEGEAQTGSLDVEDRNSLARASVQVADVVVAVGTPSLTGVQAINRIVRDLGDVGVERDRIVPVVNRAPNRRRARQELDAAIVALGAPTEGDVLLSPMFVPDRSGIERAFRDGTRLPSWLVDPLTDAVRGRLAAVGSRRATPSVDEAVPIEVGSLGGWGDEPDEEDVA